MKKRSLLLTLLLALISIALLSGIYIVQTIKQPIIITLKSGPVAHKPGNIKRVPSRCKENFAKQASLLLNGEILWTKSLAEITLLPGSFILKNGRHKDSRAIPLDAFLIEHDDVLTLELVPCRGKPLSYSARELRAEPARYIMVINNAGILKHMKKENDGYGKPLLKNILQIQLFYNTIHENNLE